MDGGWGMGTGWEEMLDSVCQRFPGCAKKPVCFSARFDICPCAVFNSPTGTSTSESVFETPPSRAVWRGPVVDQAREESDDQRAPSPNGWRNL